MLLLSLLGLGLVALSGDDDVETTSAPDIDTETELTGTSGPDLLTGADQPDLIQGLGGNDTLSGGASDDHILGDSGNDRLLGNEGNDVLDGGTGQDTLLGGNQNDLLSGQSGDDDLGGGSGNDTLQGGAGVDHIQGGEGHDRVSGDADDDVLFGGMGSDTQDGGSGDDWIAASDYFSREIISSDLAALRVNANFTALPDMQLDFATDSSGADTVDAGTGNDIVFAGQNDVVTLGAGQDYLGVHTVAMDGSNPATLRDYSAGDDLLGLIYDPTDGVPLMTIETAPDGTTSQIFLDGKLVLNVENSAGLTSSQIRLYPTF